MGRDTSGVRGMDVSGKDNYVLAMDVAQPGQDLLVVTENGYGKRTGIDEYRLTSRGAKGVKTIDFTERKGLLAAALVVKEHQELVFISQNGIVQRTGVRGINRYGRALAGRDADEAARRRRGVRGGARGRERDRRRRGGGQRRRRARRRQPGVIATDGGRGDGVLDEDARRADGVPGRWRSVDDGRDRRARPALDEAIEPMMRRRGRLGDRRRGVRRGVGTQAPSRRVQPSRAVTVMAVLSFR